VDLPVPASAAPGRDTGSAICPGSARGDLPRSVDIACPILAWSPIAACTDDLADPKRTRLQEFREIAAVLDQPAWASLDWCSGMKALSCPVMRLSVSADPSPLAHWCLDELRQQDAEKPKS
jgi:hypothetical protein